MFKALVAIFVTAFTAGLAMGAAMPMVSMSMEIRGMSAVNIGYVVAAAPLGLICASPIIGSMVNRFGLLGTMMMGGLVVALTLALMPGMFGVGSWILLRFVAGLGIASLWILSETWVNAIATDQNRGRIVAGFMITLSAGFGLGPISITYIGVESWLAFYLAAGVLVASLIPLFWARDVVPAIPKSDGWSFGQAVRTAPLLMVIALFAGVTDATQMSFYPVYAVREGFDIDTALYMLTAIVAGGLLVQFPIGA
jgi:MFS family permease